MSIQKSLLLVCLSIPVAATGMAAPQQSAKPPAGATARADVPEGGEPRYIRPETPAERKARLRTTEDPGMNPDPEKIFMRGEQAYTIFRYDKEHAEYAAKPGWVKPVGNVAFAYEMYQENDKYVWVWHEVQPEPEATSAADRGLAAGAGRFREYSKEDIAYFEKLRAEFAPIAVPDAAVRIQFEESSKGLPTTGSWRNGAAIADMNDDGIPDLVLPPQRGAAGAPAIFLGSADGTWKRMEIRWPSAVNYGTVVVGDFNKDRRHDLAFGVHLSGVEVFLGDGKGGFTEIREGLPQNFPTRRVVVADADGDGWDDVVAISEGPIGRPEDRANRAKGTMRAYLNRNKGTSWEEMIIAEPRETLGGDFLTALDFNGDKYPDFIGASVYFNATHTLFMSKEKGDWESFGSTGLNVPGRSYYFGTAAGRFVRGAKTDDALQTYMRDWPGNLDPAIVARPPVEKIMGIDRITWNDGSPKRTTIVRWEGARGIRGIATADMDLDGNLDIIYADERERKVEVLLGDGKGSFRRGEVAGMDLAPQRSYDLKVADLNGDRRPDVMLMYESDERTAFEQKNGSVRVFLNKSATAK